MTNTPQSDNPRAVTSTTKTGFNKRHMLWFIMVLAGIVAVFFLWFVRPAPEQLTPVATSAPKDYLPVHYDVSAWQPQAQLTQPFGDVPTLLGSLGATATAHEHLDMDGLPATLYRFHALHEPPLYAVDSSNYFELAWYYAAPKDRDDDKVTSQAYAAKSFSVASAVLGEKDARHLLTAILAAEPLDALPKGVTLAKCQDYVCRLVFKK